LDFGGRKLAPVEWRNNVSVRGGDFGGEWTWLSPLRGRSSGVGYVKRRKFLSTFDDDRGRAHATKKFPGKKANGNENEKWSLPERVEKPAGRRGRRDDDALGECKVRARSERFGNAGRQRMGSRGSGPRESV